MAGVLDTVGMGSSMASIPPGPVAEGGPIWDLARLFPPQGSWSEAQYLELTERTNWPIEFDKGSIEVLPMPTIEHQLILMFLLRKLDNFVSSHSLGVVLCSPLPTWINEQKYREPDILYVTKERHAASEKYYRGVDLAIEIVSDDARSHERDHVEKRALYAEAGVAEYWIVDPQQQRVLVLALDSDKQGAEYAEHADLTGSGTASSKLLDGFSVDVASVFAAGKQR